MSQSDEVRESAATDGQVIMPFYLIADVSTSMSSDIPALTNALNELLQAIRQDPVVDDLVMLCIITFNGGASVIVPLSNPSDIVLPTLEAAGGTNYGAAFQEYYRAFERDRESLKAKGIKVYRPCVFLTDGEPNDSSSFLDTFQSLFAYDPETKIGNRTFPYFVPFGMRDATQEVISLLTPELRPNQGPLVLVQVQRSG